jgi:alpha,alpha-trehalose phosphorylase
VIAEGAAVRLPQTPAVFVLGNGFIGLRGPGDPKGAPRIYLNGVFERVPIRYHEAAHGYARESDTRLAVADATGVCLTVDGTEVDLLGTLELDLKRAVLTQTMEAGGIAVKFERLVSMERPAVVATRVTLTGGAAPAEVRVRTEVSAPPFEGGANDGVYDPRVTPEMAESPWTEGWPLGGALIGRLDRLRQSAFGVAALASRVDEAFTLHPGEVRTVEMFAAYCADREDDHSLHSAARAELAAAEDAGFDALEKEHADWLAAFWTDADVELPDLPQAEQAVRYGLLQLVQAVGRTGRNSIAAKGQTGEGYEGHVFWDADSYVLPVFVYTQPEIARAMLVWRISRLEAARKNARAMGHARGALYPWRTIEGRECSSFFPAGAAQYHINSDIAYALQLYVDTTGDRSILAEGGAAMLAETARIWLEVGFHDEARGDAFVINQVTGPNEYSTLVDNNLYTNMMAAEHLRFAARIAREEGDAVLSPAEIQAMERAADAMYRPFDAARDIYAQDDNFFSKAPWPIADTPAEHFPLLLHHHPLTIYRHRVAKQADAVLATVFLRDSFDEAMRRRMLDAYEEVTVHDSTLSASAFAAAAASVGDAERAFRYWRVSALTDLSDLFGNSGHGLHMAALAGTWTALAMGFGGLRSLGGSLSFAPISAPQLGRYAFVVQFRGSQIAVAVDGKQATYELLAGGPVTFDHCGETIQLAEVPVTRDCAR